MKCLDFINVDSSVKQFSQTRLWARCSRGSSSLWLLCTVSAICGHRLNAIKITHGVPWALQGKHSDVLGERLQVEGHLTKHTFKWRKYKYSFYIVTPPPQEGKKKFSEKRIRKEEGRRSGRGRWEKVRKKIRQQQPLVGFHSPVLSGRVTPCLSLSHVKFCSGLDQPGSLELLSIKHCRLGLQFLVNSFPLWRENITQCQWYSFSFLCPCWNLILAWLLHPPFPLREGDKGTFAISREFQGDLALIRRDPSLHLNTGGILSIW